MIFCTSDNPTAIITIGDLLYAIHTVTLPCSQHVQIFRGRVLRLEFFLDDKQSTHSVVLLGPSGQPVTLPTSRVFRDMGSAARTIDAQFICKNTSPYT